MYEKLLKDGLDVEILYVMVEDDQGTAATENYCDYWKGMYNVIPPVVLDLKAHMWSFAGGAKTPGIGIIVDRETMEITHVVTGGDKAIYKELWEMYIK